MVESSDITVFETDVFCASAALPVTTFSEFVEEW